MPWDVQYPVFLDVPVPSTEPTSPVMGAGTLEMVGLSWSLGLNVKTSVVVAVIKPGCPGTMQKWLAVRETGLVTAKAHGN